MFYDLSIVTISYNQAEYLPACVGSVLSEKINSKKNIQYIVWDPGSNDGSREYLRKCQSIDKVFFEHDSGPADGLNKAFSHAEGEIGYFINSDDFILPGSVGYVLKFFSDNPDVDILLGQGWMVDDNGCPLRQLRNRSATIWELVFGVAPMVQQGLFFRMELFRSVGGFNPENTTCWDLELLCDMIHGGGSVAVFPKTLGCFRFYGQSLSGGSGGELHAQKYRNDLCRLKKKYALGAEKRFIGRLKIIISAYFGNIYIYFIRVMEILFRRRMINQYNRRIKFFD